ncbi:MAG: histidine phosphatase family protein [Candidatus Coprovivens sp.]
MIYLMRHGQDDETYIGGWSDVSLIPEGINDVKVAALWIKNNLTIKKIICSDVKRAIDTAKIVSDIIGVPYISSNKVREQNKGKLNGVNKEQAMIDYPMYFNNVTVDTVYPDGESLRDLYIRMNEYLEELLMIDDNTLIITHRGVINMFYYIFNNIELDMDKKKFGVETASIHEVDKELKLIKKIK